MKCLALTLVVGKRKMNPEDMKPAEEAGSEKQDDGQREAGEELKAAGTCGELKAFLTGKAITLKEVNDGVFSEGMMGEGMAIIPETEVVCSPADARVCVLMEDSRHACGLRLDNGMEILLHIGIDTVDMKGDGFSYAVAAGQRVKAGDALIRFSRKKIKEYGHPDVTVCIITDPGNAENIQFCTGMDAKEKETILATFA